MIKAVVALMEWSSHLHEFWSFSVVLSATNRSILGFYAINVFRCKIAPFAKRLYNTIYIYLGWSKWPVVWLPKEHLSLGYLLSSACKPCWIIASLSSSMQKTSDFRSWLFLYLVPLLRLYSRLSENKRFVTRDGLAIDNCPVFQAPKPVPFWEGTDGLSWRIS